MKLTKLEAQALAYCGTWDPHGMHVGWKAKTMPKLEALGLVHLDPQCTNTWSVGPYRGWKLTEAGRAALSQQRSET